MLGRLFAFLNKLPADKVAHALGGACGSSFVLLLALLVFSPLWACAIAVVAVSAVGAWKEWVYDTAHKAEHTPDVYDWLVTTLGGLVPLPPVLLLFVLR